jgi:hypothetical protein
VVISNRQWFAMQTRKSAVRRDLSAGASVAILTNSAQPPAMQWIVVIRRLLCVAESVVQQTRLVSARRLMMLCAARLTPHVAIVAARMANFVVKDLTILERVAHLAIFATKTSALAVH